MTQTGRIDRLLVTSLGLMTSVCFALICSPFADMITCFGLGLLASVVGYLMMGLVIRILFKYPIYKEKDPMKHPDYVKYADFVASVQKTQKKDSLYQQEKVRRLLHEMRFLVKCIASGSVVCIYQKPPLKFIKVALTSFFLEMKKRHETNILFLLLQTDPTRR